jgi:ABC-2 type transport system permease protein
MGLLLVVPVTFVMIPWKPLRAISPFLPEAAGSRILTPQAQIDLLSQGATNTVLGPWQGFAVLLVWVAVLLTVAGMLLRRRDA